MSQPPRNSVGRLILILGISGFASTSAGRVVEPLVGVMARDLVTPPETIALLATVFALPYAFCQPILGPLGDSFGKERLMPICLAVLAMTMAAAAMAPTVEVLFALRLLAGGAAGGVIPLSLAMLADRVGMEGRQVAISRFLIAVILGQLAGSSASGLLAEAIGWRGVFVTSAVLTAVTAVLATIGFGPPLGTRARFSLGTAVGRYRRIVGIPRARALFAFVFVDAIVFYAILPYVAPTLEARGEGGPAEAGIVLAGFAVGGLAYSAAIAFMLRSLGLKRMLVMGGVLAALAHLVLAAGLSWRIEAAAMIVLGFGFFILHSSFQTQVTEVAPEARASAVSLHAFSFFCGQAFGVVLVGGFLRVVGWAPTLFVCAALAIGLGLAAARVLPQPADQPLAR